MVASGSRSREQFRMQPLGHLLDCDELVGAVVELVPDGVDLPVRTAFTPV